MSDSSSPYPGAEDQWPARWIHAVDAMPSCFHVYRLSVHVQTAESVLLWWSADQRGILFLNGTEIARGPERGDPFNWYVQRAEIDLVPGDNYLAVLVWSLDAANAPAAQMSRRHGFLLAANGKWTEQLSTGIADWKTRPIPGIRPRRDYANRAAFLAGCNLEFEARALTSQPLHNADGAWDDVATGEPGRERLTTQNWGDASGRVLRMPELPPMKLTLLPPPLVRHVDDQPTRHSPDPDPVDPALHHEEEAEEWRALLSGQAPLTIPGHTRRRVLLDFDDYVCAYTRFATRAGEGARVAIAWAESLFHSFEYDGVKGHRDEIAGKSFHGRADTYHGGGPSCSYPSLWWNCGRYVEISVETAEEPLVIEGLAFDETRYPLEREDRLITGLDDWESIAKIMWRTLQMCAHETYMDCPYYEQLQYGGDTRIQILVTYATTRDARLPRKTIRAFAASMLPNGLTQSRFPCHAPQVIPQFSLYWVAMLHDFALWRGDPDFIREMLPAARRVLDCFIARIDANDRLHTPPGWNWVDWTLEWRPEGKRGPGTGHPPLDATGLSAINHLQFVYVAGLAADLERWFGEDCFARRLEHVRGKLMQTCRSLFLDKKSRLFADTPSRESFSQHAQCFALLGGLLEPGEATPLLDALLTDKNLAQATVYFRHYVFESLWAHGRAHEIPGQLAYWRELQSQGFRTTIERPDPSRSDCHAWGAHPIYHMHASVAGIRPTRPGFEEFVITPAEELNTPFQASLPHPKGQIQLDMQLRECTWHVRTHTPPETAGIFTWNGASVPLKPGEQTFTVPAS